MTHEEIEAIVGGYHGDAFRVLGPHGTGEPGKHNCWEVRAFLPQAEHAEVLLDGSSTLMEKVHPQGFFVASLDGGQRRYLLRIRKWNGEWSEFEDAYRFPPLLTDFELHLVGEGTNFESYRTFGAHLAEIDHVQGTRFAVWAPNAIVVSVAGDFSEWDSRRYPMRLRTGGVWELFIPGVKEGFNYKYDIRSKFRGYHQQKADPYAFQSEAPPKSASIVCDIGRYEWNDAAWLESRGQTNWLDKPVSIYEVHLESWLRGPQNQALTYRELAGSLIQYAKKLGFTHIQLLPVHEHPYSGSWGYQVTGYYAPTARFGTPQDFKFFVDRCHQEGLGVIIDWVPGHFPKDAHGLAFFDGTALYEHEDPRKGEHRDWGTLIFNYGRNEVREFLISNALFWLKEYHIDGLRVDAVASMLYLDYSRKPGEWIPNIYGGNENLEAISFLRSFNELAHQVPGVITIAEESTSFPGVSKPVYLNGLGFTMKWNMGWMHDMLDYFSREPVHRKYHHNNITFSMLYAFTENFVLPISHDEVVYGKRSLLGKMPGDEWQRFANVRAFLGYMYTHPGKKLLFMGVEIGQYEEWNHNAGVRWELLDFTIHRQLQHLVKELNRVYGEQPALYQVDYHWSGFEWIDFHDVEGSTISFVRRAHDPDNLIVVCCNFTPVPREKYRVGVPAEGFYQEILNTDAECFGGGNMGNGGMVSSEPAPFHGREHSISITLPPLATVLFRRRV
ncbi:MAG: 1,4-alpha-glucan branching protein GlgB [Bryobacterales bacterium]|nr:1,4-alpha-glucan branching protein GlgB [Bryobacterales bacterium]MEB2361076.1 1,4-alpha-glucan branching protein GlgB [Bryobacterales bacterium]